MNSLNTDTQMVRLNTIYEIRHFTLIKELLTFTIYFAFLCNLFGGMLLYHRSPLS